jgi:D-ribose pyranose/furanose isomerase RbsD
MKRDGILNQALSEAIAGLGHGDLLVVCDAGYPIPRQANRIDLAVTQNLPELRPVLSLIKAELIAERVVVAAEMKEFNPLLFKWLQENFADAEFDLIPHSEMLGSIPLRAKAIVRTGAFDPWGNIGLSCGVDAPRWFAREGVKTPDEYRERIARMSERG